jgi:DNA-directed RNA polymerase alpha subunit
MNKQEIIKTVKSFKESINILTNKCNDILFGLEGNENNDAMLYRTLEDSDNDYILSLRTLNALKNEGVVFVGDLVNLNEKTISCIDGIGRKSLNEIKYFIKKKGHTFGRENKKWRNQNE